jgi:hypothetical protein
MARKPQETSGPGLLEHWDGNVHPSFPGMAGSEWSLTRGFTTFNSIGGIAIKSQCQNEKGNRSVISLFFRGLTTYKDTPKEAVGTIEPCMNTKPLN